MNDLIIVTQKFVMPYYDKKDIMHGWGHIERILKLALKISENYNIDNTILILGAYFHGVIWQNEVGIRDFLKEQGVEKDYIEKIIKVSWDSQKDIKSEILEGIILHDAHLLEGGKNFIIVKSLVTGTSRGQNLSKTIEYIKNNTIGKFSCYLEENIPLYQEKEKYTIEFLKELENNL